MQQVRQQLERVMARAEREGVRVRARGKRHTDGAPVFLVPSASTAGLWHPVALVGDRLECACRASQFNRVCVHLGAAALFLRAERDARRAAARAAADARANRPFSLYK